MNEPKGSIKEAYFSLSDSRRKKDYTLYSWGSTEI